MIFAVQRFLLFSIIFFSISQFGKHFWPFFAYVSGIRVDYLSPTLYFTDILIGILFLISLPSLFTYLQKAKRVPIALLLIVFFLCMSIIVSKYSMPALYGSVKALEMIFLGYMVSRRFSEKDSALLVFLLSGAIVVQGILVITQMVTQSSVGGIWYLLGERTFSVASIGISTVSLFGKEILRAYGSFPHPNVLAFFMLMANLFVLARFSQVSDLRQKVWYCIALGIGVISLLSTFSRISILLFFSIVFYLSFRRHISRLIGSVLVLLGTGFVLIFIQRFTLSVLYSNDFTARLDLAVIAFKIIAQHLIFGVGMYNYFYYQIDYQRDISPVLLQPPHNIYLLFFLQVGFFGFLAVLFFLWKTFLRAKHNISISVLSLQGIASLLFFCILLIGFWDHYLVTLQQGMIMTAFIIGLVWLSKK